MAGVAQEVIREAERFVEAGGAITRRFDGAECGRRGVLVAREVGELSRRVGEGDDGYFVVRCCRFNAAEGLGLRLFERVARAHAEGVVDEDHDGFILCAGNKRDEVGRKERAREDEREQEEHRRAERHQQHVTQASFADDLLRRCREEHQRAELHALGVHPADEVQDDRDGGGGRCGEEYGGEEGHNARALLAPEESRSGGK